MKKYFLPIMFTFLIVFNSFMPRIVYANAYTPVIQATPELVASSGAIGAAVVAFAPEIALVACVAISCGIIYENREQLITMSGGLYQDLKTAGYSIARTTSGGLTLGVDALNWLRNDIASISTSGHQTINVAIPPAGTDFIALLALSGISVGVASSVREYSSIDATGYSAYNFPAGSTIKLRTGSYDGYYDLYRDLTLLYNNLPINHYYKIVPTMPDGSICFRPTYPTQVFSGDVTGNIDGQTGTFPRTAPRTFTPDSSISIPTDLSLDGDWTGNLVGTSDYTKAFPLDTPTDNTSDIPIVGPLIDWLTIDWPAVTGAMDFGDVWRKHFEPFYDITGSLTDINVTPNNSGGKFYMIIPKEMGGDGLSHCVLDYTVGSVYISWARTFMGWAIWLAFGWWILEIFKPKININ